MPIQSPAATPYTIDPYTQAYRALLEAFTNDEDVKANFKRGNMLSLIANDRSPIDDQLNDADFPDLVLSPGNGNFQIGRTNTDHGDTLNFQLRVRFGEIVLHEKFFPCRWALVKALIRITRRSPRLGLERFVESVKATENQNALALLGGGSGGDTSKVSGWVSIFSIEVKFRFPDSDLQTR